MKAKLSLYRKVPENGLVLFCGYHDLGNDKRKLVNIDFEPFAPLSQAFYSCGSSFETSYLREQLAVNNSYGFIIVDGAGFHFYEINGTVKKRLYSWDKANLPKKHGRGGQSAGRFARIRTEKRHAYICKVAEAAIQYYISQKTNCPIVQSIVIAGFASFKNDLVKILDPRLSAIVCGLVDIQYGGQQGLNEAIVKSQDILTELEYSNEQKIISGYFEEISKGTGMITYGVQDTMYAFEAGAIESLIVWADLPHFRYPVKNINTEEIEVLIQTDSSLGADYEEVSEPVSLIEWIMDNYESFNTRLEIITDSSPEGSQFCHGFSGIGSILRFSLDLPSQLDPIETEDNDSGDWEW